MPAYHIDTLANGLRLVTVTMPHLHVAELICYVGSGGRNERQEQSGISHFLEHMLFRGAGPYSGSCEIERAFEKIGGAVNAATDPENTCFHSRIHPDHIASGIAIFAEMLRRPHFNDLEIERRIILEEAREDYNQEGVQINPDNLMAALLWPKHPLGQPLIGTNDSLQGINLDSLHGYYTQHYTPQNSLIACSGPIERKTVLTAVEKAFGDWRGETIPEMSQPPPQQPGPHSCWVADSDSQVNIQLAFPMAGRQDTRPLHYSLLRRLLSWGGSALLPQRLREECGLTYAVEANYSMLADSGYFSVDLAIAPQNLSAAFKETLGVLDRLRKSPPEQEALEAARNSALYDLQFSLDQPEAMAVRFGWGLQADCLRTIEQDCREVKKINPDQIQTLCQELFTSEQAHLVVVGPWDTTQKNSVETLLQTF